MKIWHISDTHTFHNQLVIPENIDMVIFSGDCSNPRELYLSEKEIKEFLFWFGNLPIKYKIFVAGNHDLAIEKKYIRDIDFTDKGIIHLSNSEIIIEGIKIWGSPYSPTFGAGWAYNMARHKLGRLWATIPDNADIVITHTPPKGCRDLSYDKQGVLEFCGCSALAKRLKVVKPKLSLFGHVHSMKGVNNNGIIKFSDHNTIYSNGSIVLDGGFDKGIISNGNILEIWKIDF